MHFQNLIGKEARAVEMQHHGGIEKNQCKWVDGAGVDDIGVVCSRRYAKSILLQAYLECLNTVCHSKQRDNGSTPRMQTKLVKMLTSKTKLPDYADAYKFCSALWDELSLALIESQGSSVALPKKEELSLMQGHEVILRLALLADFYRYQKEDLALNREESTARLCAIRANVFKFLTGVWDVQPDQESPTITHSSNQGHVAGLQRDHPYTDEPSDRSYSTSGGVQYPTPPTPETDRTLSVILHESTTPITTQSDVKVSTTPRQLSTKGYSRKRKHGSLVCDKVGVDKPKGTSCLQATGRSSYGEDSVSWAKYSFSTRRKSYYAKLVRAFQVGKTVGHPMLTLHSEWGLSCYYNLAVSYTTDQQLEMAAACLPELRQAVDIIHRVHFHKLSELKLECQMLLYAVLNCHINWVDHNHKQILIVPDSPVITLLPRRLCYIHITERNTLRSSIENSEITG